ncbi:MAG: transglutaminase domain-containing protein [Pseudomonadales bacterium]
MLNRLLGVLCCCVLLAGLILGLGRAQPYPLQTAAGLSGERWYRLLLDDDQVGYLHTEGLRDPEGRWRFTSDLRFVLTEGHAVRIREMLLFAGAAPFPLLRAEQWNERPDLSATTLIRRGENGYESLRASGTQQLALESQAWTAETWDYDLADYLGVESWLLASAPATGARTSTRTLDFDRTRVTQRQFRVLEHNETGYLVASSAPYEMTSIQLDAHLAPQTMRISGLFQLERSSRARALAPRTALQAASYYVPVDRPLQDHTRIDRLVLKVVGSTPATALWPKLVSADGLNLELDATTPAPGADQDVGALRQATVEHPADDPRMRRLAREAVADLTEPGAQLAALTAYVHGYLNYSEVSVQRHVLALLDDPTGDCTEYADLLTTLARSLGLPARTVFGIAYQAGDPPAFRFHAWNEVLVNGDWVAADPTWNQVRVDATHIPLPDSADRALQLLTGGADLAFEVRDVGYF